MTLKSDILEFKAASQYVNNNLSFIILKANYYFSLAFTTQKFLYYSEVAIFAL